MSSNKAGYTLLRQAWWPRWPRWRAPPHSSFHGRSTSNIRSLETRKRLNRIPIQRRYLSSTICRPEQLATILSTTPKAPLSQAALDHISDVKHSIRDKNTNTQPIIEPPSPSSYSDIYRALKNQSAQVAREEEEEAEMEEKGPSGFYRLGGSATKSISEQTSSSVAHNPAPLPNQLLHSFTGRETAPELPPMRLSPSLGRSVTVDRATGMDLSRALTILKAKLNLSQIRSESIRQRFHERPGMKRKRLRSQRWRKKFMTGFRTMVRKVQHMRRQGW